MKKYEQHSMLGKLLFFFGGNNFMRLNFCVLCLMVATGEVMGAPAFKNGERVAFIGASITHGGSYHTQLNLYYATRFPGMRIVPLNCGISGDSAAGVISRYAWDIAPLNPTHATINIGLNDIGYSLYGNETQDPQKLRLREERIATHLDNMDKLLGLLTGDGIAVTIISLTPTDETGTQKKPPYTGVNAAIKGFLPRIKAIAEKYNAAVIDITARLEEINLTEQRKLTDFTLLGGARVQPGGLGHLVMAYIILKAQGMEATVSNIKIEAATGNIVEQDNCKVYKLESSSDKVSFELLSGALPFPVKDSMRKALELVPFMNDLNQELLTVNSMAAGDYELLIDGVPVYQGTSADFGAGLNLAGIGQTPQYRQACEVQELLEERAEVERKLRRLVQVRLRYFMNARERTPEVEAKILEEALVKLRNSEGSNNAYNILIIEDYQRIIKDKDVLLSRREELLDRIHAASQPVLRHYQINRIKKPVRQTKIENTPGPKQ